MLDRSGYKRHRVGIAKKPKRSRDTNQLATFIVGLASGEIEQKTDDGKNPAAVALERLGGLKGGSALRDVHLTNDLNIWAEGNSEFVGTIVLDQRFFKHLKEHAVPLNEHAIARLKGNSIALDLYLWLVYRLPRIGDRPVMLDWKLVQAHFGSDYKRNADFARKFRLALRHVLAAYPEARVEVERWGIRLHQ